MKLEVLHSVQTLSFTSLTPPMCPFWNIMVNLISLSMYGNGIILYLAYIPSYTFSMRTGVDRAHQNTHSIKK